MPFVGAREDEDPTPIYESYDDPSLRSRDIEFYRNLSSELGLATPESMFAAVAADLSTAFQNTSSEHHENDERIRIGIERFWTHR